MASWIRRHKRVLLIVGIVSALMIFGYAYRQAQEQEQVARDCAAAQEAVAAALIAIRDGDIRGLEKVTYTGGTEWIVFTKASRRMPRIMAHLSNDYQLRSLSDHQIRDSIEIARNQRVRLLTSILRWSVSSDMFRKLQEHPVDALLVECTLAKRARMTMCMKEDGGWKILEPPSLSVKVMRYPTIDEASRHNDAIAE